MLCSIDMTTCDGICAKLHRHNAFTRMFRGKHPEPQDCPALVKAEKNLPDYIRMHDKRHWEPRK